ncbi:tetratricopeptide repeat protein [Sphingosinicella sp.]|uniref:tetratricopeptide repeat protein n=1 Tax=Sphingosinicella sp. TaxID=1917971 RepID=UPI0040382D7D
MTTLGVELAGALSLALNRLRSWVPAFAGMTPMVLALALLAACADGTGAFERGRAAFEAGDMRAARVELMNALQADPANAAARLLKARIDLALGDGVAAEAEVVRARQAGTGVEETRHLLAHARLLQGDARGALSEVGEPTGADAAYRARIRARALAALGDGGAGAMFDRAMALGPRDSEVFADVAIFRRNQGNIAGALQAVDQAVAFGPRNARALLLRGELTRSQYGLAAALPWFDRALEVDPGYVDARLERAITYGDLGRMQDMLADAREAHRLSGGVSNMAFYLQAVLAARARDYELARAVYNRTNGAFADRPSGMLLESAIDFGMGNVERAAQRLARLVAIQPGNRRARRLLAAARSRMDDPAGVIAAIAPLAVRPDADSYSLTLMGRALAARDDAAGASAFLARAAAPPARSALDPLSPQDFDALRRQAMAEPGNGPVQVRLISALLARGLGEEALARARQLQAANPGAPEVHMLVGDALGTRGDFAGAAEQYRRAANLAFSEPVALRLIEALRRSNQVPAADGVLTLFLRQNPRNVPAQIMAAARMMEREEWAEAIAVYEGLRRRIGNNDATILNNLAWAYAETGDFDRALPYARRAWALDRDNPATADTLGWILYRGGSDPLRGLALMEQAARGAPNDAAIRRRLEQARRG